MLPAGAKTCFFWVWGPLRGAFGKFSEKHVKKDLLCSCRQPPAGIRDFSGHPKVETLMFVILGLNSLNLENSPVTILLEDHIPSASVTQDPERLFDTVSRPQYISYNKK